MNLSTQLTEQAAKSSLVMDKIANYINQTPLLLSRHYQTAGNTRLYFKTENFQYTGSFKLRGAFAKLTELDTTIPVITASSGNHGIACAFATQQTGHQLTVVLPEKVVPEKHDRIKQLGANTVLFPGDAGQAEQQAQIMAKQQNLTYLSPYNDATVIAGQGTIGLEILQQLPTVDNVFVSMGGGGLISGIGSVLKTHSPKTQIIGVSATNSAALAASMQQGEIIETNHQDTLADGIAGAVDPGSITLPLAMEIIDQVIHITEPQIESALKHLAWEEQLIVEGAAALALAAFLENTPQYQGKNNVVVLCGANFNREKIAQIISA